MAGHGGFPAPHEKTREFAETRIMPDDQKGFYRGGRSGKKVPQGVNVGVVERSFAFAGWFLRYFTQYHVECIARAPCRRNEGEIENESGCTKIGAHSRRVGAALSSQAPIAVAFGCGSTGFGMANKEEPWHRAKYRSREIADGFRRVRLGGAKGYRRFVSRTMLALASIDDKHRFPFVDFGQTPLFSPRDGLAKGKSARC